MTRWVVDVFLKSGRVMAVGFDEKGAAIQLGRAIGAFMNDPVGKCHVAELTRVEISDQGVDPEQPGGYLDLRDCAACLLHPYVEQEVQTP